MQHLTRMPDHSAEFRRCLVDCDTEQIVKIWKHVAPDQPCPETPEQALICIHMARTAAERMVFRFRAYSHAWLRERGIKSLLPDKLLPRADRMYPKIVSAVGICVASPSNHKTAYHHHVSTALCDIVEHFYADGIQDTARIHAAMKEVHDK